MSASMGSITMALKAVDEASGVINQVRENVTGLGTAGTTAAGNLDAINKVDYTKAAVGISGLMTAAVAVYSNFERIERATITLDKALLRVSNDTDLVAKAQEKYDEAVAKFGADSPQATQAAKDLGQAMEKLRIDTEVAEQRQNDYNMALLTAATSVIPIAITSYTSLQKVMAGLGTSTTAAGSSASAGMSSLTAALGTLGVAAATVGAVASLVRGVWEEFDNLKKSIDQGNLSIGHLNETLLMLSNPFAMMAQGIVEFMKDLGVLPKELPSIGEMLTGWFDFVNQKATEAFNGMITAVTNVLPRITSELTGFIESMKSIFQGFYDWFIGHSLWTDMWNAVRGTTQRMIGEILGDFNARLFGPLTGLFSGLMQGIQGIWNSGLSVLNGALNQFAAGAQGIISGVIGGIQGAVNQAQAMLGGIWSGITSAFGAPAATTSGYDLAHTAEQLAAGPEWPGMQVGLTARDRELMGLPALTEAATEAAAGVEQASQQVTEAMTAIPQITVPALEETVQAVATSTSTIVKKSNQMKERMVGRSIWPDMLNEMLQLTYNAMSAIVAEMEKGFNTVIQKAKQALQQLQLLAQQAAQMAAQAGGGAGGGGVVAAYNQMLANQQAAQSSWQQAQANLSAGWVPNQPLNLTGADLRNYADNLAEAIFQATFGRSSAGGPATTSEVLNATLPVSVVVDGVTVSRVIQQRQITQQRLAGYT